MFRINNKALGLKKKKAGKNHLRLTIINIVLSAIAVVAILWILKTYLHIADDTYTNDAQVEAYINPINTRISSYIKEIRFIEHQKVKKGDTLVIIDDRELQTQLEQAEAAYQNAIASEKATRSAINTIKSNLAVIASNIAGEKAKLWNAQQNYDRYEDLLKDEAVTRQQYEEMKTAYDAQKAQYQSLLRQQEKAVFSVDEANTRIAINEAEIKRSRAALHMARINLSYTLITAPNNGVLGRRTINEGQLIQAGQQIATLVTDDQKWVVANFREKQMPEIKIGEKIQINVDALGGNEFDGIVTAISEATGSKYSAVPVDNSTGNFVKVQQRIPVRIEFTPANDPEQLDRLRAGMNVEVKLKEE